jgi:hypothetical protein
MAYSKKPKDSKKKAQETHDLFKLYSDKREVWAEHAQEDKEFRLGKQWTKEQRIRLEERGQAPVVVNRIHPAVEAAKAMLTSEKPAFRVSPREDSDNKVAQAMNGVLEYMWHISNGDDCLRTAVDDYYTTGMGCLLLYQDPMSDMGKGDVKVKDIDPLDVYIDPNCRDRFCDDAENIIISRLYTKEQAKALYPMYKTAIKNASTENFRTDRPTTSRQDDGELSFPEDDRTQTYVGWGGKSDDYVRGYERYYKEVVDHFRVFQNFDSKEDLLDEEQYELYLQRKAFVINGQVIGDPAIAMQLMESIQQEHAQAIEQAQMQGVPEEEQPRLPSIQEVTFNDLLQQGLIDVVIVPTVRVHMCVVMGDKLIYERVLPISEYPLVFLMNVHTRTPFPTSDVRMVKGLQEYINKTRSLIIAHATTSTNQKILIPSGSVDMREFETKWSQPGVAIEVDFDQGPPQQVAPTPLPNELYANEKEAKNDIDHQLGLYEMMMGNAQAAPQTYKATISLDEFGQRKMKSKQADLEVALKRIGQLAIPMIQQLYTNEKVIRLLQPNNSMNEFTINQKIYDDKQQEIGILNDITVGKYDVIVVTGSTLPTNRYAQLEMYMDAYSKGIIDKREVLKKTEVFDMQGVLERTDTVGNLSKQLEQAQATIKSLQGDIQTREREVYHARQRAELEKFKAQLDSTSNKARAAETVFEKRLNDATGQISREVRELSKETAKPIKQPLPSMTQEARNKETI